LFLEYDDRAVLKDVGRITMGIVKYKAKNILFKK
jgi:hypothetical protein